MLALVVLIAVLTMPFLAAGQEGPPPKFDATPKSIDAPPPSIDTRPKSLDAGLVDKATQDAAAAVRAHNFADALAACDRGLRLAPKDSALHYYKSAALRERGVQSWNAGDKNKDENLKNEARADWAAVLGVADEALANLPQAPAANEMRYRFVREKAEARYFLAHTSGIARADAMAALDAAVVAAGEKGPLPNRRSELAKLKLYKANVLVDSASVADATEARALFREVLELDPKEFDAMVGMSTACIIALDWTASAAKLKRGAQACTQEALAFRAQVPPTDPRSARLQQLMDALQTVDKK